MTADEFVPMSDQDRKLIIAAQLHQLGDHSWCPPGCLDDDQAEPPEVTEQRAALAAIHEGQDQDEDHSNESPAAAVELTRLTDLLNEPDEPVQYRIDRLLPAGGRAILAAQYKAGKTTLRDNLVRSLADGTPFLDQFPITMPEDKAVVVIDNEMSRDQVRRWLRDQGIINTDRVQVAVLRGQVHTFNLLDGATRHHWAAQLQAVNAGFVIFDCLRPVLDALGLSEDKEAGQFLVAYDVLLREADVGESAVLHHMGHSGERSRGDSRIRDWPDVEWRLVRQTKAGEEPDPADPRYFKAYGRDVDVPEALLTFDHASRHLVYTGGNRKDAATQSALADVLDVLPMWQPAGGDYLSQNQVEQLLRGTDHPKQAIRGALKAGTRDGLIIVTPGPRNSRLHSKTDPTAPTAPGLRQHGPSDCATAPIGSAVQSDTADTPLSSAPPGAVSQASARCERCGDPLDGPGLTNACKANHTNGDRQ